MSSPNFNQTMPNNRLAKVDWLHSVVWCIETSNCTSWDVINSFHWIMGTSNWLPFQPYSDELDPSNPIQKIWVMFWTTFNWYKNDFVIQGHPSAPLCYFFFPVTPRGDRWSPHSSVLMTALATLKRVVCSKWADDDDDDGCLLFWSFCIWELFVYLIWR